MFPFSYCLLLQKVLEKKKVSVCFVLLEWQLLNRLSIKKITLKTKIILKKETVTSFKFLPSCSFLLEIVEEFFDGVKHI